MVTDWSDSSKSVSTHIESVDTKVAMHSFGFRHVLSAPTTMFSFVLKRMNIEYAEYAIIAKKKKNLEALAGFFTILNQY